MKGIGNLFLNRNMNAVNNKLSVIIDIDGVIVKSRKAIPGSSEAISLLQKLQVPFVFFTNNISKSEQFKAQQLTNLMQLELPISKDQVVLNYTPMKKMFSDWKDKLVLIIGRPEIDDYLPFQQIPHYVTINEYVHIFPEATPLKSRDIPTSEVARQTVSKRLGLGNFTIFDLKFDNILVLNTPVVWQDSIQVIIDVMSTEDGRVSREKEFKYHKNHIPIFTSLNDLWIRKEDHPLPRFLIKPFCLALKAVFKEVYGNELEITHFGKPERKAFQFVHNHLDQLYGKSDNYVMIGDNLDTDIEGAYNYGWKSILVETGVSLHTNNKVGHLSKDLKEAVQWALRDNGVN